METLEQLTVDELEDYATIGWHEAGEAVAELARRVRELEPVATLYADTLTIKAGVELWRSSHA